MNYLEIEIFDKVYQFKFGMGFMREVNKLVSKPVDGVPGVKQNIGLQYTLAQIIDGDVEALVDALVIANKGCEPRITRTKLDEYVESDDTDIDELFSKVKDFLRTANVTKKTMNTLLNAVEQIQAEE